MRAVALGQHAHGRAGIVVETGAAVTHLKPGDRVALSPAAACINAIGEREWTTSAQNCWCFSADISWAQAAAVSSAHATAWRLLVSLARLQPGDIVLLTGLGDAVAVAALQIAMQMGTHVIAASDNANHLTAAQALGAAYAIDWSKADLPKEVRGVTAKHGADVAINFAGGDSWSQTLACLARGGRLATAGALNGAQPQTDLRRIFWNHLQIFGAAHGSHRDFEQVWRWLESTGVRPLIDRVVPFDQEKAAQQRFQSGAAFGSVVVSDESCAS